MIVTFRFRRHNGSEVLRHVGASLREGEWDQLEAAFLAAQSWMNSGKGQRVDCWSPGHFRARSPAAGRAWCVAKQTLRSPAPAPALLLVEDLTDGPRSLGDYLVAQAKAAAM